MTNREKESTELARDLGFKVDFMKRKSKFTNPNSYNCCAVQTLARIMNLPWEEVYEQLTDIARKEYTPIDTLVVIYRYLKDIASKKYDIEIIELDGKTVAEYMVLHDMVDKGIYQIIIDYHTFPIINGTIYDNSNQIDKNISVTDGSIIVYTKKDIKGE